MGWLRLWCLFLLGLGPKYHNPGIIMCLRRLLATCCSSIMRLLITSSNVFDTN